MPEKSIPYVGPRPFSTEEKDRFFGRDVEADELLSLVLSERLVLLFAPSGAGKSSLLNARLIPELQKPGRDFFVLPVARVTGDYEKHIHGEGKEDPANIFIWNVIDTIYSRAEDDEKPPPPEPHMSLTNYLQIYSGEAPDDENDYDLLPQILIIDQFEEIFTTHPEHWNHRQNFFEQLRDAMIADPLLWVIISMREEYLAPIEPYAYILPDQLRTRFYLQRLKTQAAIDAIILPAKLADVEYAPGVAESLMDDLAQVPTPEAEKNNQSHTRIGQFVEPVQLQVVCLSLWSGLPPNTKIITSEMLADNVDDALANYYAAEIKQIAKNSKTGEFKIRSWVETKLISKSKIREQVTEGKNDSEGLKNIVIQKLMDSRLVRVERRSGANRFELAHDRLIEPVLQNNLIARDARLMRYFLYSILTLISISFLLFILLGTVILENSPIGEISLKTSESGKFVEDIRPFLNDRWHISGPENHVVIIEVQPLKNGEPIKEGLDPILTYHGPTENNNNILDPFLYWLPGNRQHIYEDNTEVNDSFAHFAFYVAPQGTISETTKITDEANRTFRIGVHGLGPDIGTYQITVNYVDIPALSYLEYDQLRRVCLDLHRQEAPPEIINEVCQQAADHAALKSVENHDLSHQLCQDLIGLGLVDQSNQACTNAFENAEEINFPLDKPIEKSLLDTEKHLWKFTSANNGVAKMTLTGIAQPTLRLLNSDGSRISRFDGNIDQGAEISQVVRNSESLTQTYMIEVSGAPGTYTLGLQLDQLNLSKVDEQSSTLELATPLPSGGFKEPTILPADGEHYWRFQGEDGQIGIFQMNQVDASSFPIMKLLTADGTYLSEAIYDETERRIIYPLEEDDYLIHMVGDGNLTTEYWIESSLITLDDEIFVDPTGTKAIDLCVDLLSSPYSPAIDALTINVCEKSISQLENSNIETSYRLCQNLQDFYYSELAKDACLYTIQYADKRQLALDTPLTSAITSELPDYWSFSGEQDQVAIINSSFFFSGDNSSFDWPSFNLLNANSELVYDNESVVMNEMELFNQDYDTPEFWHFLPLPEDGEYTFVLNFPSGLAPDSSVDYEINLVMGTQPDASELEIKSIELDTAISDKIILDNIDEWSFMGKPGQEMIIHFTPDENLIEPWVSVQKPDRTGLELISRGNVGHTEILNVVIPEDGDGEIIIVVSEAGAPIGNYSLEVNSKPLDIDIQVLSEKSVQGQDLVTIKLGTGPRNLFVVGGLHAGHSPVSTKLLYKFLNYFQENPEALPDDISLYLVPNINPDAAFSPGNSFGRLNANRVDLNRNWGLECSTSNPAANGGAEPFSEPESQALQDLFEKTKPEAVLIYGAKRELGLAVAGRCGEEPHRPSETLAATYASSRLIDYTPERIIQDQPGEVTNSLAKEDIPSAFILLTDYEDFDEEEWLANLDGLLAILEASQ